jgi:hypothetical protein
MQNATHSRVSPTTDPGGVLSLKGGQRRDKRCLEDVRGLEGATQSWSFLSSGSGPQCPQEIGNIHQTTLSAADGKVQAEVQEGLYNV